MDDRVKLICMRVIRAVLRVFFLLPIHEDRIVFSAYSGAGYSCNPKYVYEYLRKVYPGRFSYIWGFQKPDQWHELNGSDTVVCRYRSLKYYYYRLTSKFYFTNAIEGSEIPKRSGQVKIQTWHGGGCYKNVIGDEKQASSGLVKRELLNISETDLFLSSCEAFSNYEVKGSMSYSGQILSSGLPRNDRLVKHQGLDVARKEVLSAFGIPESAFVVLYAPTWRYEQEQQPSVFDCAALSEAIEKRFRRQAVILLRAHLHSNLSHEGKKCIDVTEYPDMQELLMASDMLISDYSSSIWDYSFLRRPCLLYVPDLDQYLSSRGFLLPIETWGFPLCRTDDDLGRAVREWNEQDFERLMAQHHSDLGSFERGMACESVAEYLLGKSGCLG